MCGPKGEECSPFISVMHNFEGARRFLAEGHDLIVWQRGMTAVDVANDIGIGGEHDIFINQAGTRNRGAAGMNGALNPVLSGPGDHLAAPLLRP